MNISVCLDLEDMTEERIAGMTREEAKAAYERLNAIQSRARDKMELLKEKIWPGAGR